MLTSPQETTYYSCKERNLFMAGVGSGKSHVGAFISAKYITNFPNVIGFIGANTHEQLSKSTLKRIFEVWAKDMEWQEGVDYVVDKQPLPSWPKVHSKLKSYSNTISFNNGALIFLSSLENYKAIDGTEFGWAILDETKDTREEAVKEVIVARLRQNGMFVKDGKINSKGGNSFNPLYILTSPAKVDWLNKWFELDKNYKEISDKIFSETDYYHNQTGRRCVVISSTYHNAKNLPSGYIENLLADYKGNDHLKEMLVFGSPIAKSGGEFYHQFKRLDHVKPCTYNPNEAIHISFDFNVQPYITAIVCQSEYKNDIHYFRTLKEFCLSNPRNNCEDLCAEILQHYPNSTAFIHGDASGRNNTTLTRDIKHNYEVIERCLQPILAHDYDQVPKSNPGLAKRRDFANHVFAGGKNVRIEIDDSCTNLIADFEFVKEGASNTKLKQKVKGVEKYGHTSDAWDYVFMTEVHRHYDDPEGNTFIYL